MKKQFGRYIVCLGVGLVISLSGCGQKSQAPKKTISISGAWAIYPTAVKWAEEFQKLHPEVRIDVSAGGAGKGATDAISGLVDIGMVSREPDPAEIQKGAFPILILHDAVFPTINSKNPAVNLLKRNGMTQKQLADIWIYGTITAWNQVVKTLPAYKQIHIFTRSDACGAAATWAKFLGNKKQEDLRGVGVYGDPGMLDAVNRDVLGIGYNNFSFVYTREGNVVPGITIIPIDANNNGIADPQEILDTRVQAKSAIEQGTYPAGRKNYFFTKGKPKGLVKEFIQFALSEEGTKFVDEVGTSLPLPKSEREKVIKSLE
ncbi:MAG: substrate-binding domain-containing protein [bacterium]|nr:substrate-binding domain-containing protein [bacterium]